jgi:hypothetical protein
VHGALETAAHHRAAAGDMNEIADRNSAEAMARRSVAPSTMSLLGLVRHLAEVERATFRVLMARQDVPRLYCSDTDRDGDFDGAVPDPTVVAEAWEAWRAEVDIATRFVAEAPSLDIIGEDPLNKHGSGGGSMSLRDVLVVPLPNELSGLVNRVPVAQPLPKIWQVSESSLLPMSVV